jgi:hypothetical protein
MNQNNMKQKYARPRRTRVAKINTPTPAFNPDRPEPDPADLAIVDDDDACLADVDDACLTDVDDACLTDVDAPWPDADAGDRGPAGPSLFRPRLRLILE